MGAILVLINKIRAELSKTESQEKISDQEDLETVSAYYFACWIHKECRKNIVIRSYHLTLLLFFRYVTLKVSYSHMAFRSVIR